MPVSIQPRPGRNLRSRGSRVSSTLTALLVAFLVSGAALSAAATVRVEAFSVIATFLLHFAQFTTWPDTAFDGPTDPLVVGVVGSDPFGNRLEEAFQGETIRGRPVVIKRFAGDEVQGRVHLLFLEEVEPARLHRLLTELAQKPVLTVRAPLQTGDVEGGMVRFGVDRGRVIFMIDRKAVKEAGLEIHSRLLKLAQPVSAAPD